MRPLLAVVWAFPTTFLGLIFVALGLLTGGRAKKVRGVLEAHGGMIATLLNRGPLARARIAAVTLGHVILAPSQSVLDESRAHEWTHVRQCERWGPLFLPAYAAESIWAVLRGKHPYRDNRFEREALSAMGLLIRKDDPGGAEIATLLRAHLDHAARHSPPESIHALDLEGLRAPEITFWSVWMDGALAGCGALKELAPDHGEIKSMHTALAHRGKGVAARLLAHILEEAKARSYRRVSLETGTMEGFAPARALYSRFGFVVCSPFAQYREDPNSVCMTLELTT